MYSIKSVLILIDLYALFSRLGRQNSTPTLIPPATQAKFNYKLIVFEYGSTVTFENISLTFAILFHSGANIFVSSGGLLKLGDFGSSIKLKNPFQTCYGEISNIRGTVGKTFLQT